jgi:hypothetical protein
MSNQMLEMLNNQYFRSQGLSITKHKIDIL